MSLLIRDAYDYDTASFKNNIKVQYCKTCFKILRLLSGITDGVQVQFRSTLFLRTRRLHMYYRREQASSAPSHPRAQHLPQLTKALDTCTTTAHPLPAHLHPVLSSTSLHPGTYPAPLPPQITAPTYVNSPSGGVYTAYPLSPTKTVNTSICIKLLLVNDRRTYNIATF